MIKKIIVSLLALCALLPIPAQAMDIVGASMSIISVSRTNSLMRLRVAARDGDFDTITNAIANAPDRIIDTPLFITGHEYFIDRALSFSAENGQMELLNRLLSHYPEAPGIFKKSDCLWKAAFTGKLPIVQSVFRMGAPIERCEHGNPLIEASKRGHEKIVEYLIEEGANIKVKEWEGEPVLCIALKAKNNLIAQTILASIPKEERDRIKNAGSGIIAGLITIKRLAPTPPKDIQKIIAQMLIAPLIPPLVDKHMAYAHQLLNDDAHRSLTDEKRALALSLFPTIQNTVERKIRRVLFSRPAATEQEQTEKAIEELKKEESAKVHIEDVD